MKPAYSGCRPPGLLRMVRIYFQEQAEAHRCRLSIDYTGLCVGKTATETDNG